MNFLASLSCDKKIALKISLTYVAIAVLWILFSDQILLAFVHEPHRLTLLQSVKGWFFVLFTGVLLFFLFQKEIFQKKLIENKLRRNEQRLKETQEIARLGSWELDVTSNTLWWSDETYGIFGFEVDDETAMDRFIESIHPEDKDNVSEMIRAAIAHGTPLELDYRIVLTDGDVRYLHEESRTLYDESLGEVVRRVGSVQDITVQKKMAEERENLIKELEKSLEEIKVLRGIVPLCSFCKKIRDDSGYWEQVDVYIHKYLETDVSHSVCPACMAEHYPQLLRGPEK